MTYLQKIKSGALAMALLCVVYSSFAQKNQNLEYHPSVEVLKNRTWFHDAKYGLFIHWGLYSILGDGEWVMNDKNITIKNYSRLEHFFYPMHFDAKYWV